MQRTRTTAWKVAGALLIVVIASSCGASDTGDSSRGSQPEVSKYTQTWPEDYASTTCEEWLSDMTQQQRWAGAADMLAGARNRGDGGTGLPPDALITDFEVDVTEGCTTGVEGQNVAETAAGVYVIGRTEYRP